MTTPRPRALLAFCLAALGAAGCSNNPYPLKERHEALLYSAIGDDPKSLDPQYVYNIGDGPIANAVYECFLQYNFLKHDPFKLEPGLGAEMPKREPYLFTEKTPKGPRPVRGERWTFRVKRGLRFQDDPCFPGGRGREITAADFVYSFKRMADPSVQCPILSYIQDKIVGLDAYAAEQVERAKRKQKADLLASVEGLQLDPSDPYVFRVLLNQPYPQLRYLMAMAFTTPMAHEAVETYGKELARHMVGEGPYVMTEYRPRQRIVLRRNPNYRQDDFFPSDGMPGDRGHGALADAGKRLPLNDGVILSTVRESITAWNLFLQGYLDHFQVIPENRTQVVSRVGSITPQMAAKGIKLTQITAVDVAYFAFNMKDPVVGGYDEKHRKLRQALSLCYDVDAEINLLQAGQGKPAQWLVPPGVFGYDPDYRNPYRQDDLARAKKLLAEAGYPDGIDPATGERLTITWDNGLTTAAGRQFVGFVQKQFDRIGVRLESHAWRGEVMQDRVDRGAYQFVDYGWIADYPDPENFLFILDGRNARQVNPAAYDRPEYNRLLDRMRSMDDTPARLELMRQMREIAVEDCPCLIRYHSQDLRLTYPWYGNSQVHPIALNLYKYRKIDAPLRAELRAKWNPPNYLPLILFFAAVIGGSIPAVALVRRRNRQTARKRMQSQVDAGTAG